MSDQPDESHSLRETSDLVPPLAPPDVYDPVIEAYKKDVDRTLIRENLKLTHEQRVEKTQRAVDAVVEMREAARRRLRERISQEYPGVYGDPV